MGNIWNLDWIIVLLEKQLIQRSHIACGMFCFIGGSAHWWVTSSGLNEPVKGEGSTGPCSWVCLCSQELRVSSSSPSSLWFCLPVLSLFVPLCSGWPIACNAFSVHSSTLRPLSWMGLKGVFPCISLSWQGGFPWSIWGIRGEQKAEAG